MKVKEIIAPTEWFPGSRFGHDSPLVSVLLPTFRRGASGLFMKAVRSVLDQTLRELELIVVDDASTDGTADQIRTLMEQDGRVSCLRHPFNIGLPAISEYEAFRRARASYIAFAFDDDEFLPDALQRLLAHAVERNASFVHGHVDIHGFDPAWKTPFIVERFGSGPQTQSRLAGSNYIANNAVLLHRRVLEKVGLYDPHVAISRLCDWDLWRRAARSFALHAIDVPVGHVLGATDRDSLGHTYAVERWQATEWINLARNDALLPANFPEYDVLGIPDGLTRQTRHAIEEIGAAFRHKAWHPEAGIPRATITSSAEPDPALEDGRLLVVTRTHDASTTLCFERLPARYQQRVMFAYSADCSPEDLVGASAVIFVRELEAFSKVIEAAEYLGIPRYYFLDDNLIALREDPLYGADCDNFSEARVRDALKSFSGVLLSSPALFDDFRVRQIHDRLHLFPPIATPVSFTEEAWGGRKDQGTVRIAFFGGAHRHRALREVVYPAIRELAREYPVELFLGGVPTGFLEPEPGLRVHHIPFELSYELALGRFAHSQIDILVHPPGESSNNPFKTLNVLINAWSMRAIPVLGDHPPYSCLAAENIAVLCGNSPAAWHAGLARIAANPTISATQRSNLDHYCSHHFSGEVNSGVLEEILRNQPVPGYLLRDKRYRALLWRERFFCSELLTASSAAAAAAATAAAAASAASAATATAAAAATAEEESRHVATMTKKTLRAVHYQFVSRASSFRKRILAGIRTRFR